MTSMDELREIGVSKKNRIAILEEEAYMEEKERRLQIERNKASAKQAELYFANRIIAGNF